MYVKKQILENVGPIPNAEFDFPFDETGNPRAVTLEGKTEAGRIW